MIMLAQEVYRMRAELIIHDQKVMAWSGQNCESRAAAILCVIPALIDRPKYIHATPMIFPISHAFIHRRYSDII